MLAHKTLFKENTLNTENNTKSGDSISIENPKVKAYLKYELPLNLKVNFLFKKYPVFEYTRNDINLNNINWNPL